MKEWWKSKTLWVNVCAIGIMVAEYLLTEQIIMPEVHAIILAAINLALRVITKTGLTK